MTPYDQPPRGRLLYFRQSTFKTIEKCNQEFWVENEIWLDKSQEMIFGPPNSRPSLRPWNHYRLLAPNCKNENDSSFTSLTIKTTKASEAENNDNET